MRLVLACSPRAGGNSDHAAALLAEQGNAVGMSTRIWQLRKLLLRPCLGCGACFKAAGPDGRPRCVLDPPASGPDVTGLDVTGPGHAAPNADEPNPNEGTQDAAARVFDQIDAATGLILVMPVYFYGPPAQAKALIDRAQVYWAQAEAQARQPDNAIPASPLPLPPPPLPRPGGLVLIAGRTEGPRLFEASELIGRCFLRALGLTPRPSLCLRGLDGPDALRASAAACTAVREYGASFG